ncbi:MAG TPA: ABC transporter substrate-binding protein [Phototrophicaceae bacterium]|nr:ABC transporter substrate-binding protein [Phototrophicaceae bacterium]
MQHKNRSRLGFFAIVIGLLLLTLQGVSAQSQPGFNIGVLDSERGPISNGARLAVREINAAGGVLGADGTMVQLNLVTEPSNFGLNLNQAVTALKAANVQAVIGPQTSDEVLNGLAALQSLGVPVITTATDDTITTKDTTGMIFRARASDMLQGQALASYLISTYQLTPVATVQLDVASTAAVVGFTTAASALGVTPKPAVVLNDASQMNASITTLATANPAVIVAYGAPSLAASLYSGLRTQNWKGLFVYNQALDPAFNGGLTLNQESGVVAATTWPFTALDDSSTTFLNAYIRAYGELPSPIEAASYDAVKLIAQALTQPGSLHDNLVNAQPLQGVQGVLKAQGIAPNDLSNNVAIFKLGDLGAPEVLARYQGNQLLPNIPNGTPVATLIPTLATPLPTATPSDTPTPQGVTVTVKSQFQNVRSGPSSSFDILGTLNQGETAAVIGASLDFRWVVINFRGTQGWMDASLLTINGDLRSVPVVPSPPTPTPNYTATPTPSPYPDLIIVSATVSPTPIQSGQSFTVNITVGNIGGTPAGAFSVAGTFAPNNLYLIGSLPGLAPQATATLTLSGVLNGSGTFTTSLMMDPNNQVNEGPIGEQNNLYNLTYTVGTPGVAVLHSGSATLNLGDTIDLEGNAVQGDANWNNSDGTLGLKGIFGGKLAVIGTGSDVNSVTYAQIDPNVVNQPMVARSSLNPGTIIGIITADGHRGAMLVTAVSDTQLSVNYLVYNG